MKREVIDNLFCKCTILKRACINFDEKFYYRADKHNVIKKNEIKPPISSEHVDQTVVVKKISGIRGE